MDLAQFKSGNTSYVCQKMGAVTSKGVFVGDDPFSFPAPVLLVQISMITLITRFLNFGLTPLGQPTVVAHLLAGVILGPTIIGRSPAFLQKVFPTGSYDALDIFSMMGLTFFLFIVGTKTDPTLIKQCGRKAVVIGISAFSVPLAFCTALSVFLKPYVQVEGQPERPLHLVAASQSMTGFLVIACLLTELKILNTDIGRLAVSSALVGDAIGLSMAVVSVALEGGGKDVLATLCGIFASIAMLGFVIFVIRPTMLFIIKRNPEGKSFKGLHAFVVVVGVLAAGLAGLVVGQHAFFGALILGLSMPDGPPIGTALVAKLECLVSAIMFPIYIAASGLKANFFSIGRQDSWAVALIVLLGFVVKIAAAALPSLYFKVPKREAFVIGLMMNGKGVVELIIFNVWRDHKMIDQPLYSQMILAVLLLAAIVTPLVKALYDPSKRYLYSKVTNIQHSKRDAQLRVLTCVHTPDNVPTLVNLLEISNATRESPIYVYALELIELLGRQAAVLISHQPHRNVNSSSSSTEHIINAFRQYEVHNQGFVTVQAFTAMAHMETMHEDVCNLALEKRVNIVIAPFHKQWAIDGKVGSENRQIRAMNMNILDKAPCSVGILVDRNVMTGSISVLAGRSVYRVGVIFMGGCDDGEVLAYASRIARHERVKLTVIRLLAFGRDNARERKLDTDTINEFKRSNLDSDQIDYKEEVVKDGEGLASLLKGLGENYDLVMVGRHQRKESQLFSGLDEWSECPELGIVGDMLASPDLGGMCSVLVVRQQNRARGGMNNVTGRGGMNARDAMIHDMPYEGSRNKANEDEKWAMTMETMA